MVHCIDCFLECGGELDGFGGVFILGFGNFILGYRWLTFGSGVPWWSAWCWRRGCLSVGGRNLRRLPFRSRHDCCVVAVSTGDGSG
jgi:hypothetical protein